MPASVVENRVRAEGPLQDGYDVRRIDTRAEPVPSRNRCRVHVRGAILRHGRAAPRSLTSQLDSTLEESLRVGCQRVVGRPQSGMGRAWLQVDMRPASVECWDRIIEAGNFVQAAADHQQGVGCKQALAHDQRRTVTGHAKVVRVIVGKDTRPAPGRKHRHSHPFAEVDQRTRRARGNHAVAGQDRRALRAAQELDDRANVLNAR